MLGVYTFKKWLKSVNPSLKMQSIQNQAILIFATGFASMYVIKLWQGDLPQNTYQSSLSFWSLLRPGKHS